MIDPDEMLRRLRSGMNAMFDAASADAVAHGRVTDPSKRGTEPFVVDQDWGPYKKGDMVVDGVPIRRADALPPIALDTSPSYRRDTEETFSADEIAYMTGGRD